jgi:predicted transcriptional regulator
LAIDVSFRQFYPRRPPVTKTPPRPTDAELAILRVLWRHGDATVREVLHRFNEDYGAEAGYTTILKNLQIMTEKGLVVRDETKRPQVYSACSTEEQTQQLFIDDLLAKAFDGSAKRLVMRALAGRRVAEKELRQVERMLDALEKEDA